MAACVLLGCSRAPAPGAGGDPEAMAKLKAEIKGELKSELKAELIDELGKLPLRDGPRTTVAAVEPGEDAPNAPDEPAAPPVVAPPAAAEPEARPAPEPPAPTPPEPLAAKPEPRPQDEPPIRSEADRPKPKSEPEAEPEPAPFPKGQDEGASIELGRIQVVRFEVARAIDRENREPTDAGHVFDFADTPLLYGYLVAKNEGEDSKAIIEWLHGGETRCRLELKVGHSTRGWRTWASCKLNAKWIGPWTARVLDEAGKIVAKSAFKLR